MPEDYFTEPLNEELAADERLLWSGAPKKGRVFTAKDWFMIPFSLVWLGFSVFWEAQVLMGGAPVFLAFFGLPFVGVGLYLLVGRFWVQRRLLRTTVYGVTDRRVLIVSAGRTRRVQSYGLEQLGEIQKTVYRSGLGDILFSVGFAEPCYGQRRSVPRRTGFFNIENPSEASAALQGAIAALHR